MSRVARISLLLLLCGAVGLMYAGQLRLLTLLYKMRMTWAEILRWELTRWFLWPVFIPAILWFSRKRFYYSSSKIRFALEHLLASVIISLAHLGLFSLVFLLIIRLQNVFPTETLWQIFRMIFTLDFHIGIAVYATIVIADHAFQYSRREADLRTRFAEAKLDALRMQLHPHFLFNTLNSISALLHKDPEAADEMIGELGNFLRLTLQNPGKHEVTLQEELNFLKSYLEIETVRFRNFLKVSYQIQEETLPALLPNLILQPIIENAIRHAIAPRKESGAIEVRSSILNGDLFLQILDNGPGLDGNGGKEFTEGIGLRNVKERLMLHYGASHTFRLSNRPEGGLQVELQIPFRTMSEQEAR
jgi:two-component system, LytTR family, sensor kinase